jgi:ribose-phosphate pyrophosphokinase
MNIIGDVTDRHCLLVDDIVDSGGTLCNAAEALLANGAKSVSAYITHGVLSGEAVNRVNNSQLEKLLITDTIQATEEILESDKFGIIKIAELIGEAMRRTTDEHSVSSLFD